MPKLLRSLSFSLLATLLYAPGAARAAEAWDAPAFTTPTAALLQSAAAIKRERTTNVVVLLDERSFVLDEQQRLTRTYRLIYRVDTPEGVESWAASGAHWQPWHQQKPTIRARVITTDGREHLIDQKMLVDAGTNTGANQIYDDDRKLEGPLPAVAVGSVVEEEIVIRDTEPMFSAGAVMREFMGRPVPVLRTRIIVDAPESLPLKRAVHLLPDAAVRETRAGGRVRWVVEQQELSELREAETNTPPESPAWPSVEFASGASWEQVAAAYREMTDSRIRPGDARPLLAGLGAAPSHDTIVKLVERLHREVRYTGVEFGSARLIPEYPSETLRRKFGDCKDKSTLLIAALRAAGVDAYLALLSAGLDQDVTPDLPGLGQFNHAIVYIPGKSAAAIPELWIDATAEYTRVGVLPAVDTNRLALIIREGTRELVRTPVMRSADNRQYELREFHLAEYGAARVVEVTRTHGTIETEYRAFYAGPDTKTRTDDLKTYAHDAYRAKALANYTHTSSTDFSAPYEMRLEMTEAPIGFTDLETAAIGINVANVTSRLPEYFDTRVAAEKPEETKRVSDVVFEPFVTEWHYRMIPPPGFQARKLPPDNVLSLGPAKLEQEFRTDADGTVNAVWRFDTVKGRYTPAETDALIKALRELNASETLLISFDQVGVALSAAGDFRGALAANEALVAKHPRKAVHRLRNAAALLEAGLGTRAQREALAATKLEPKSALAWKPLGWALQHDAVGRRFGEGYDRAGAIAAYKKARALEPENTDIAADLAVLYEHDANGARYSPKANLSAAVDEYRARLKHLSEDDASDDDYANNLFYALLYSGRYDELRTALRGEKPSATQRALTLTVMAATDGGAKAIEASHEVASSEADRRAALAGAGNILMRMREYAAAADLIEASSRGQTTTAANTQRIAMLRKTTRVNTADIAPTDPRGAVLRTFAEVMLSPGDSPAFLELLSRRSPYRDMPENQFRVAQRALLAKLGRQDLPYEVGADLMFGNVRLTTEGEDAFGYRVTMRSVGEAQSVFVLKEDGAYRVLTVAPEIAALADMALERVAAGDLDGARRWLDWARAEQSMGKSDDPLAGPLFVRAWSAGAKADADTVRAAAAILLADSDAGARALPLLRELRPAAQSDAMRLNIDLALANAYSQVEQWQPLHELATQLATATPASAIAFRMQQWSAIQLKKWEDVEAAARERLARLPDDSAAREMLVSQAEARGRYDDIAGILQPLIDSGRATPREYNQYAWSALLDQPVQEKAVEAARMAYDETQGKSYAIAHTLACVYAASGKPREARDLLLKGMDQLGLDQPNDSSWYGFGLIAEAYGDHESARDYYAKVARPEKGVIVASSVYALSQARLAVLPPAGRPAGRQ